MLDHEVDQAPIDPCRAVPGYKILVLHAIVDNTRKTTFDHIYCYPTYRPGNIYAFHHLYAPVTPELAAFPFDAVIMNYCFLAYRVLDDRFAEFRDRYAFLADSQAIKIAIPQDECTRSAVLDEWLDFMKIDVIYTPYTKDLQVLYPRCFRRVPIKHAFAGYSNPKDVVRLQQVIRPFRERSIDVGTRVTYTPPYFGRQGLVKALSAERFRDAAKDAGFAVDISTRWQDSFVGDDWFRFLGSCRFTLVTRAGASMHDPRGDIRKKVDAFLRENPDASFEEVEAAFFPGLDRYDFSCVSPRLFEAATARTGLILREDRYVDGLEPYRHYIPLKADFSNLDEVFRLMRDDAAAEKMIDAAYQHLVASGSFSYEVLVDDVLAEIAARRPTPRPASEADFSGLRRHYERLVPPQRLLGEAPPHWSQVARFVGHAARSRGELGQLAGLVAAKLRGVDLRSVMAAEMAGVGNLDPKLAGLAVEAMAGLALDRRHLDGFKGALADLSRRSAPDHPIRDWRHCEYIYDAVLPRKKDER